jgi:hypothetical protein
MAAPTINDFIDLVRSDLNDRVERLKRDIQRIGAEESARGIADYATRIFDLSKERFEQGVKAGFRSLEWASEKTMLDKSDLRQMTGQLLMNFLNMVKAVMRPEALKTTVTPSVVDEHIGDLDRRFQFMIRQHDNGLLDLGDPHIQPPRFGYNQPPNDHISRDAPLVLRQAAAGAGPAVGLGAAPPHYVELPGERPLDIPVATDAVAGTAPIPVSSGDIKVDSPQRLTSIEINARVSAPLAASSSARATGNAEMTLTPSESPAPARAARTTRTAIGQAVLQNQLSIELIASSLVLFIDEKLSLLLQTPPNSDDARAIRDQEIADCEELKRKVELFLSSAGQFAFDETKEDAVVESTTSIAEGIGAWWHKCHVQICGDVFKMGLFTLGLSLCSLAGSGGVLAAIVPGVLVGGKPVADVLKAWSKGKQN